MALLIAAAFFAVFLANVVIGSMGLPVFLTDVQEMLVLMASAVAFVVAMLRAEARAVPADREEES
ncbi:MAG: hypothetical protein D6811_11440 [Alphaproteobacteria bacterium]|nr:MAG: hypothetical protein D6811_11440 [Alphaproteobacteria bacterium]